ncbi:MAG: translesion error-prone DNA polymerase V autoproteolytic subunit [Candidatus Marinimicrobia bacterium]|nr:translesion error-prone DNA polymerase V autoproteolytic subunit [Candidatus Neomarinimicrobiota bacterium]MBT5096773.1 translesion error-prone DNA polymerase V autoproteolytic subunit [Candidatus Neomarinimicrobiota bacterium]MDG2366264.1 translesion error-prone DNA polymerase V autoproteolytic subunit [Candidatus Neomarinimicrobiota bacterium]
MKNRGKLAFQFHAISKGSPFKIPLMSSTVTAGFPSPADDHLDLPIDLNEYLVKHPAATFYVRVQGDSMDDAGIHQGDLLIVDRAEPYTMGSIVLAVLDGEFTVKKLMEKNDSLYLLSSNTAYQPIKIETETDFKVWGVVTYIVHGPL